MCDWSPVDTIMLTNRITKVYMKPIFTLNDTMKPHNNSEGAETDILSYPFQFSLWQIIWVCITLHAPATLHNFIINF